MTTRKPTREPPPPYASIDHEVHRVAVHALRALYAGTASADQQQLALAFILEQLCDKDGLSYRPGKPDDTAFAEGRRWIGLQIVHLLKVSLSKKPTEQGL